MVVRLQKVDFLSSSISVTCSLTPITWVTNVIKYMFLLLRVSPTGIITIEFELNPRKLAI